MLLEPDGSQTVAHQTTGGNINGLKILVHNRSVTSAPPLPAGTAETLNQRGVFLPTRAHTVKCHNSLPKQTWITYHLRTALGTAIDIINLLIG